MDVLYSNDMGIDHTSRAVMGWAAAGAAAIEARRDEFSPLAETEYAPLGTLLANTVTTAVIISLDVGMAYLNTLCGRHDVMMDNIWAAIDNARRWYKYDIRAPK